MLYQTPKKKTRIQIIINKLNWKRIKKNVI